MRSFENDTELEAELNSSLHQAMNQVNLFDEFDVLRDIRKLEIPSLGESLLQLEAMVSNPDFLANHPRAWEQSQGTSFSRPAP